MIEFERCQFCSFSPTNMNDYCEKHRPTTHAPDLSALWGLAKTWRGQDGRGTRMGRTIAASDLEKWLVAAGIPRPTPEGR